MAMIGVFAPECWDERLGLSLRMAPVTGRIPGVAAGLKGGVALTFLLSDVGGATVRGGTVAVFLMGLGGLLVDASAGEGVYP
jgi:hypothetical protein